MSENQVKRPAAPPVHWNKKTPLKVVKPSASGGADVQTAPPGSTTLQCIIQNTPAQMSTIDYTPGTIYSLKLQVLASFFKKN